jgi:hypothetical protein
VGAEVRPESAEPTRGTGEPVCENRRASVVCRSRRRGTARASLIGTQGVVGSTPVREGTRAIQWSEPLRRWIGPVRPYTYREREK